MPEAILRQALLLALGIALAFGVVSAVALTQAKPAAQPAAAPKYDPTKPYPAYTAPRLAIGQPDLQGVWSNATLTTMTRARTTKAATYTEDEVKKLEQAVVDEVNEGNKRTD